MSVGPIFIVFKITSPETNIVCHFIMSLHIQLLNYYSISRLLKANQNMYKIKIGVPFHILPCNLFYGIFLHLVMEKEKKIPLELANITCKCAKIYPAKTSFFRYTK